MNKLSAVLLASGLAVTAVGTQASVMLDGLGGPAGYGELAMGRNDDGSSAAADMPFSINYFSNTYNSFYINNNGNITFNDSVSAYTPIPFPISNQPMIAPYWADVDTRCDTCGSVYVAGDSDAGIMAVTWDSVGYYASNPDKTNSFQVVLIDRTDTGEGNFDVEFRYDNLSWTTGDASGGSDGLAGTPAQAGYDAGDETNFFALPGSFSEDVLDLATTSNTGEDGVWRFAIRDGALPGATVDNPLMPVVSEDGGWEFDFNIEPEEVIFIDPDVAIGYDYIVDEGPNVRTVVLPTGFDDDMFELWIRNGPIAGWILLDTVEAGETYDFGENGVSEFRVTGIDISNMVDPDDQDAFVTGLTFVDGGQVSMRQIPITTFVPGAEDIPEPATLLLLLPFVIWQLVRRRKQPLALAA